MRRVFATLLTGSATLALLALLALPAREVLRGSEASAVSATPVSSPTAPARLFGVYVDPWHVSSWARATGVAPDLVAKFEAFSVTRPLDPFLRAAAARGVRQLMLSWEPWRPVDAALGTTRQFAPQPGYRNSDIAAGVQDHYVLKVARGLARFPGPVYLRYAHEMNGVWYPWSRGPATYIAAWRRVARLVRSVAPNVRMVWSANPNLYEPAARWRAGLKRYWPGGAHVDVVGSTMISFGGSKTYPVRRFEERLRALRRTYRRPLMLTEVNTAHDRRLWWLHDLRALLHDSPWITGVVWSQLPSRGTRHMRDPGDLDWDVQADPAGAAWLQAIANDGAR